MGWAEGYMSSTCPNTVKNIFSRQLGFTRWTRHDDILTRFACPMGAEFGNILDGYEVHITPIFACKFSQSEGYENYLALANESGVVAVIDTADPFLKRYGVIAHNNAIFDIAWLPKSHRLVTASGDHSAALIDLSGGGARVYSVFIGHARSLKTVACSEDNATIFATGGRDSRINLWDSRVNPRDYTFYNPALTIPYSHVQSSQLRRGKIIKSFRMSAANSVTGLIFQDEKTLISCSAGDGYIKVWDMRKTHYIKHRAPIPKCSIPYGGSTLKNGFSHLIMDPDRGILYASCLDNVIYAYNANSYDPEPIRRYYGHTNHTFYVKMCLGEYGKYILSGSSDNNAYIWHRNSSTPIVKLRGHDAEVTGVGWSAINKGLVVTCSDDLTHKFWTFSDKALTQEEQLVDCTGFTERMPKEIVEVPEDVNDKNDSENVDNDCFACGCCSSEFKDGTRPGITRLPDTSSSVTICKSAYHSASVDFESSTNNETDSEECDSKKRPLDKDDSLPSTTKLYNNNDDIDIITPVKKPRIDEVGLLLEGLPNYVVNGTAPHLRVSPAKDREIDWLTKLSMRLKASCKTTQLPKYLPSSDSNSKPTSVNKPNPSYSNSPLLKYFKVVNNPTTATTKSPSVPLPST